MSRTCQELYELVTRLFFVLMLLLLFLVSHAFYMLLLDGCRSKCYVDILEKS